MPKEDILKALSELHIAKFHLKKYLKNHLEKLYSAIVEYTKFLGTADNVSMSERIYCIKHDVTSVPKCQVCKCKNVKFDASKDEYRKWCSVSCACKDPSTLAKSRKTRLDKYGSETYSGSDKARKTRMSKNNGHWHSSIFAEKLKHTKLEKYGDENFVNSPKARETKLAKYGDEHFCNASKAERTKLERYGDEHWNNRDKFKHTVSCFDNSKKKRIAEKRKAACIEAYGTEHAAQCEQVKAKTRATCLEKYGVETPAQIDSVKAASVRAIKLKSWKHILADKSNYVPMFSEEEYVSSNGCHKKWKWQCTRCGNVFEAEYDNGQHHRCYSCWPSMTSGTSLLEQQICDYVKTLTSEPVLNKQLENKQVIEGREIDIYMPSLKLGIEVDGLYWHSEDNGKGMMYHLHKTEECEKRGLRLVHIFEDEWTSKQDIVKARLKHMICKDQKKVFARKCIVENLPNDMKDQFLDKHHIQGRDVSKLRYGLRHNGELVAVMTFIKSRFDKKFQWELSRYATAADIVVVGGASKLLKHFEKEQSPSSLVTYADRRWSDGNMYFKLGFQLAHKTKPSYFYVKSSCRYSRIMFQKHKLKKMLDNYDESLSEVQNMKHNGYTRIFDCGNLVFTKLY